MSRPHLKESTVKKLFGLSGNQCAFPDCNLELIISEETIIADMCHIEGVREKSARYNPNSDSSKLYDYDNFILLCKNHHKIIDDVETKYTVEVLKKMKEDHIQKNKEKEFTVSGDLIKKIIQNHESTQWNIQTGSGTQIATQTGDVTIGITSITDAERLFELLFEKNFPKLKEEAQELAKESAEKYCKTFMYKAKMTLQPQEIERLADPDVQYMLTKSIVEAGRRDEDELRENLSYLMVERIKNSDHNLKRIVYNEAIETIGKLTKDSLKILTLCFILRYAHWTNMTSIEVLDKKIKDWVMPFIDFKNTEAEFQHIVYAGCGELGIGSWNYINAIREHYWSLSVTRISSDQLKIHKIPNEIINKLFDEDKEKTGFVFKVKTEEELEKFLKEKSLPDVTRNGIKSEFQRAKNSASNEISKLIEDYPSIQIAVKIVNDTTLKNLSLTSVGIVIAATYFDRIIGGKIPIDIWIK